MSKTTHVFPARSTSSPVRSSLESWEVAESGRLSRSSRKSVRSASTGASVNAAKKRERVERAGSRSRSRPGHEGNRKGLEPLVERLQGAFPTDGVAEEDRQKIDQLGSWVGITAHQPAFRTGRDPFGVIRLKPPQGTFPHPALLRLTAGDAPAYDRWDAGGASWTDGPCRHRPDRECDGHASHSLS